MASNILIANNSIFKTGNVVFISGDDLPPPVLDINPAMFTGLANNDPVSVLRDSSGNNNDAIQMDSTKQGIYKTNEINGLPAVQFDGVNDNYQTATNCLSQTIFAILKCTDTSNRHSLFGYSANGTNAGFLGGASTYFDSTGFVDAFGPNVLNKVYVNGGVGQFPPSIIPKNPNYVLLTVDIAGGANPLFINIIGTEPNTGYGFFSGYYARLIVYNQRLTTIQRKNKIQELLTTYGL